MSQWTFYDYVDHRGHNVIQTWYDQLSPKAQADIDARLGLLRNVRSLDRPAVGMLHGECKGLIEIRIHTEHQQLRILGAYGPGARAVTLLFGAREKGNRFEPRNACELAFNNKAALDAGKGEIHERD